MRTTVLMIMLSLGLFMSCQAIGAGAVEVEERVAYRSGIIDGVELLIYRTGPYDPAMLGPMAVQLDDLNAGYMINVHRVEVRMQDGPAITVGTWLSYQGPQEYFKAFDVLDYLIEPGEVTLMVAEAGSVYVRQFRVGSQSFFALVGWEIYAAIMPRDRTNTVGKLRRNAAGKLEAEVGEKRIGDPLVFTIPEPNAADIVLRVERPLPWP